LNWPGVPTFIIIVGHVFLYIDPFHGGDVEIKLKIGHRLTHSKELYWKLVSIMWIRWHEVLILRLCSKHKLLHNITLDCPRNSLETFSHRENDEMRYFLEGRHSCPDQQPSYISWVRVPHEYPPKGPDHILNMFMSPEIQRKTKKKKPTFMVKC
jgi:hypothetical protein